MFESLTLAFVLGAMPAEPTAAVPTKAPVVNTQQMTEEQRRKRAARLENQKKKQKQEARRKAAQRKALKEGKKTEAEVRGRAKDKRSAKAGASGDGPYTHPSGMRIAKFKPGDARVRLGPQVNKGAKGKDAQRRKIEAGPKKQGG